MALASWLRGVRIPKGDTKPGKVQHFGANFDGTIFLESCTLRPYGRIRGRLVVETRFMLKFTGIHVQLEGDLYLNFASKTGRNVYRKRVCILENTICHKNGDQISPIRHDVVPPVPEGRDLTIVILPERSPDASENFLFTLPIPGDTLPAPFKSPYGSLTYKVVAYMRSIYGRYVQIAEKSLDFPGYHNLSQNVDGMKPLKIKRGLLDASANIVAILILESGAYLPEEAVPFTMIVRNPGMIPLSITVFIAQKITYNVDGTLLATCTRIDMMELFEGNPEADTLWKGNLTVPKKLPPSYSIHPSYEVKYAIQFKVVVENHGTIKGTAPLYIGTTKEPIEHLEAEAATACSLSVPQNPFGERRGSTSSVRSENSFRPHKKASLPSYSQVNSPVRCSIESLPPPPPPYDEEADIEGEEDHLSIPVPSTSSIEDE
ncbi:unnamed protein product [Orchesella dallaii]|uniref:Arrestin C-terminal-like domain-containing protein n=1 Tax=Orchesella dallaii TaxID=48710 RepID=A0ABP1QV76_9HEXA